MREEAAMRLLSNRRKQEESYRLSILPDSRALRDVQLSHILLGSQDREWFTAAVKYCALVTRIGGNLNITGRARHETWLRSGRYKDDRRAVGVA